MSTVLWANRLIDGRVTSDESDKQALYEHTAKIDDISRRIGRPSFQALCDTTDLQYNLGDDDELPDGMSSTDELMARDGVWMDAAEAVDLLTALLAEIEGRKIRFGLLSNDHAAVVAELKESLAFAQDALAKGGRFNFSVVM